MPQTRSMAKKESVKEPSVSSTAAALEESHANIIGGILEDGLIQAESETAKTNILRLFYQRQTQALITPEIYNDAEDPRFRANIKIAACFVLSELSRRHAFWSNIDDLFRRFCFILEERKGPLDQFDQVQVWLAELSVQRRFVEIWRLPSILKMPPEDLFRRLADEFMEEHSSGVTQANQLTRAEAGRHLSEFYGDTFKVYNSSRPAGALMTWCLNFPSGEPKA